MRQGSIGGLAATGTITIRIGVAVGGGIITGIITKELKL
jgi:hypothetical protein